MPKAKLKTPKIPASPPTKLPKVKGELGKSSLTTPKVSYVYRKDAFNKVKLA